MALLAIYLTVLLLCMIVFASSRVIKSNFLTDKYKDLDLSIFQKKIISICNGINEEGIDFLFIIFSFVWPATVPMALIMGALFLLVYYLIIPILDKLGKILQNILFPLPKPQKIDESKTNYRNIKFK